MVVDKTLDKYLADIIFTTTCNGFEYDSDINRFQLKVSHITEQMFNNMADKASDIGKKLTIESVNSLLQWIQKDAFYCDEILYSLPISLFVNGESIRVKFNCNGLGCYADLMKMTESEFLVLQTDLKLLKEQRFMQIYANDNMGKGETVYISSVGNVIVSQAWLLKPLDYHSYADWHFMRDLWRNNVADNLWHAYNVLVEFANVRITWDRFMKIMNLFNDNGLSTFVFRMMLNSINR